MKPHTVIAILEAKAGREDALSSALKDVAVRSRAEEACLQYRLHQNADNPLQFILYEQWISKEKHAEQFSRPYILAFAEKLEALSAGPYQVIFATELV